MKKNGSEILVEALKKEGVDSAFGLIGYYVSPIFQECCKHGIKIYDARHEQGVIHMADGYAQTKNKVAVAIVTGGPGFANAVSAIIKASKADSPVLVIVGGFPPANRDRGGLEDMDQLALVRPFVKWCKTVYDTKRIEEYVESAYRNCICGRKGVSVLEVPITYLFNEVESDEIISGVNLRTEAKIYADPNYVAKAVECLKNARKPVIIAGEQVFYDNACQELMDFIRLVKIPAFTVNAGRGSIPDSDLYCFGSGRTIEAGPQNEVYKMADVVFVIGTVIDYSLSFGLGPVFNENAKIIYISNDVNNMGKSSKAMEVGIVGNVDAVLLQFITYIQEKECCFIGGNTSWLMEVDEICKGYYKRLKQKTKKETRDLHPYTIIQYMNSRLSVEDYVIVDGSNAMFWGCILFRVNKPGHFLVGPNSDYGQMGSGLPVAMGVKVANQENTVVLYTGDGSFGFDLIDIGTALRHNIKIIVVIHNDNAWGFCQETQRCIFGEENKEYGTYLGITSYHEIVNAFGGVGVCVASEEEFEAAFDEALKSEKLYCINVQVDSVMSPGADFLNGTVK